MKTPKDIFDNRYIYYRDALGKPPIPLEARQLIFDMMEEYHRIKVENLGLFDVRLSLPSNDIIEKEFEVNGGGVSTWKTIIDRDNHFKRVGAKWLRDKLKSNKA